jgi:transcriptional regulator with XRE-family HTH domain
LEVGGKINTLRIEQGLSREQLAEKIDVTHQQLAKYEKGLNRISLGRFWAICTALKTPPEFFFDKLGESVNDLASTRLCMEMSRNFLRIESRDRQEAINALVRNLTK